MISAIFLNTFFPTSKTTETDLQAKIFIEVAREAIENAETEMKFGNETENAIIETGQEDSTLVSIAIWHYQKGIERYQEAIRYLEQAKRFNISAKYLKYIELKIKKCLEKIRFIFTKKIQTEILLTN